MQCWTGRWFFDGMPLAYCCRSRDSCVQVPASASVWCPATHSLLSHRVGIKLRRKRWFRGGEFVVSWFLQNNSNNDAYNCNSNPFLCGRQISQIEDGGFRTDFHRRSSRSVARSCRFVPAAFCYADDVRPLKAYSTSVWPAISASSETEHLANGLTVFFVCSLLLVCCVPVCSYACACFDSRQLFCGCDVLVFASPPHNKWMFSAAIMTAAGVFRHRKPQVATTLRTFVIAAPRIGLLSIRNDGARVRCVCLASGDVCMFVPFIVQIQYIQYIHVQKAMCVCVVFHKVFPSDDCTFGNE